MYFNANKKKAKSQNQNIKSSIGSMEGKVYEEKCQDI